MLEDGGMDLVFPRDHREHDTNVEWWWTWGRLSDETIFHAVMFIGRKRGLEKRSLQYSLHRRGEVEYHEHVGYALPSGVSFGYEEGCFLFNSKHLSFKAAPLYAPVERSVKGRHFYAIPALHITSELDGGKLDGVGGMDHEWGDLPYPFNLREDPQDLSIDNWACVAIRLDCGSNIGALVREGEHRCHVDIGDSSLDIEDFQLDASTLKCRPLGISLRFIPLDEEKIFSPMLGMKYSEQALGVETRCGKHIGWGIRERTYGEMSYDNHSI